MAQKTQGLYWFRPMRPYVQSENDGVLMPDVCSRGYKLVGRELPSPSPWCVYVILVAGVCVRVGVVVVALLLPKVEEEQ